MISRAAVVVNEVNRGCGEESSNSPPWSRSRGPRRMLRSVFSGRYWIEAATGEGVAAQYSFCTHPCAAEGAVASDGINKVTAAGRLVSATSTDDGREGDLVKAYHEDEQAAGDCGDNAESERK